MRSPRDRNHEMARLMVRMFNLSRDFPLFHVSKFLGYVHESAPRIKHGNDCASVNSHKCTAYIEVRIVHARFLVKILQFKISLGVLN
jgi:hypothetical protein